MGKWGVYILQNRGEENQGEPRRTEENRGELRTEENHRELRRTEEIILSLQNSVLRLIHNYICKEE